MNRITAAVSSVAALSLSACCLVPSRGGVAAVPAPVSAPAAPAPAPAPVPEKVSIDLRIEFDTAQAVVKPEYDSRLQEVASFLRDNRASQAEIEGHTDSMGSADDNKSLSQRRADAVRQALIDRFGVDGGRLTAAGYGQERPIADNATPEGRSRNRRVVATFTGTR